jgi:hypothetical protein
LEEVLWNLSEKILSLERKVEEPKPTELRKATPFSADIMKGEAPPQTQFPNLGYDGI